jgi:predicted Fe-Mo cluster-binding NifX family protein
MKIAVTSQGTDLNSEVDPRFGRAAYILIVDSETMEYESLDNSENINRLKGAGIQASVMIKNSGAEILMTGYCGPNAVKTLNAAKIKIISNISGTVQNAIDIFKGGNFSYTSEPNTEGHW